MIAQVFQVALGPGEISAWHAHHGRADRLFVNRGAVRIVLSDARAPLRPTASSTSSASESIGPAADRAAGRVARRETSAARRARS